MKYFCKTTFHYRIRNFLHFTEIFYFSMFYKLFYLNITFKLHDKCCPQIFGFQVCGFLVNIVKVECVKLHKLDNILIVIKNLLWFLFPLLLICVWKETFSIFLNDSTLKFCGEAINYE